MDQLARFPLLGGEAVVVQLGGAAAPGPQPAGNKASIVQQAQLGFEEAAGKLQPIAQVLLNQMKQFEADEVKLELSVRFCAELGLILAKSEAEGHCKLEMIWKRH